MSQTWLLFFVMLQQLLESQFVWFHLLKVCTFHFSHSLTLPSLITWNRNINYGIFLYFFNSYNFWSASLNLESYWIVKSQKTSYPMFPKLASGLCSYCLDDFSSLYFSHRHQWTHLATLSRLLLHSVWVNLMHLLTISKTVLHVTTYQCFCAPFQVSFL